MGPTTRDFQDELARVFAAAQREGKTSVQVNSGDLHRRVGGYPGTNHRMPVCCKVLMDAKQERDTVVSAPPSGQGASLTIRYALPR